MIAGACEVVEAFLWGEGVDEEADAAPDAVDGSLGGLAQESLKLGELDGVRSGLQGDRRRGLAPTTSMALRTPAASGVRDCP